MYICTYVRTYIRTYLLGIIDPMQIIMYALGREPPDNNVHTYVTYLSHTYVRTYLLGIIDPR